MYISQNVRFPNLPQVDFSKNHSQAATPPTENPPAGKVAASMACKDPGITPFPSQQKIQGCTPTSDFVDFWPFETGNWMKLGSLGYMK